MSASRRPPRVLPERATVSWAVAIAAAAACIALAVWVVALHGDLAEARDQVATLTAERDTLRRAATATVFDLAPTAQGPADASGTLYLTATGSGVLDVVNLPQLDTGLVYQLWFLPPGDGPPIPGTTFVVGADGIGFAMIAADTGSFKGVSISAEPEGGSTSPTGPLLLSGATSGARG